MFSAKRSVLKKILQCNIKNFKNMSFCQIGASSRYYSQSYNVIPLFKSTLNQEVYEKYKYHVHYIIEYLTTVDKDVLKEDSQLLKDILNYNLPSHTQDTGPLMVSTYRNFVHPEKLTSEGMNVVYTTAWAHDLITRGYQIMDDVLDSSETRNNKLCWYKTPNVGLKAVYDSIVVVEASFMLIKNHLRGHPSYFPILELTNETIYQVALGQILDVNFNFDLFTVERWKIMTKYLTTSGLVIDPIVRGMYLAEFFDKNLHYEVKNVLLPLGEYVSAQNDMLDCYGNSTLTGKYGNDIPEGKCSWLAVQALADANSSQRELFKKHYGKSDENSQETIRELYKELNVYTKFLQYEEESYKKINGMVEKLSGAIPKEFMFKVVNAYYGKI